MEKIKIGFFGIGNAAYWPQFAGLLDSLQGYYDKAAAQLKAMDVELVDLGIIDTPEKAMTAGHDFRKADVELIFIYVTTYALTHTVLPVVRRAKVPVVVLNLAPDKAVDYSSFNKMKDRTEMTGKWLEYCSACPVPEIANAFKRTGIRFFQVTGHLNEEYVWREVAEWISAAKTAYIMSHNRTGCMGHYYNGMLDIYSDITNQIAHFGGHFEIIEVDELTALREQVTAAEISERTGLFHNFFDIQPDCSETELARAAKTSVALDKLASSHQLGSLAYYYMGTGVDKNEDTMSSVILGNSLLTGRGIPVAGEYEIKNVQAMKILDSLGAGGSFTEYYAIDYNEDIVLMGHDGPGHIKIAEGKTKVRPLQVYHGKVGRGLSVEMSVRHGEVTLLSVAEAPQGRLKLVYAQGESVPGPVLELGNTNSRYKFKIGARHFIEKWNDAGPAHHCAVGVGHIGSQLEKFASLLDMEAERIC